MASIPPRSVSSSLCRGLLLLFFTFRLCRKLLGAAVVPVMKGFSEAAAERLLFLMASDCGSSHGLSGADGSDAEEQHHSPS